MGVDSGGTGCPIPGLSGVLTASEPGYSLHRPEEVSVMPKKSILKKRIGSGHGAFLAGLYCVSSRVSCLFLSIF